MTDDPDLAAFVREHVGSVWALELLLLLKRDPARAWTESELVAELRASTALIADNLQKFERGGLVAADDAGCVSYRPAIPALDELAGRLEQAYRERPVAIVSFIARPKDPVQGLADAFKFRGDK